MTPSEDSAITRRLVLGAIGFAAAIAVTGVQSPALALQGALAGLVYPTDPWKFNNSEGTRYLDVRERDANGNVIRRHMGIDAQGNWGQPIYSVAAGTVVGGQWGTTANDRHGWGNYIRVRHSDGFETLYAHFSSPPLIGGGAGVARGQQIGTMGGSAFGDLTAHYHHLHFEVFRHGANVNPLAFLNGTLGGPTQPPEDDMFSESDRNLLLNVYAAIFNGGPSMNDGGKSIAASLASIAEATGPIERNVGGTVQTISLKQEVADTKTNTLALLERIPVGGLDVDSLATELTALLGPQLAADLGARLQQSS